MSLEAKTNLRFEELRFNKADGKHKVASVFEGKETSRESKLAALFVVIFRLRNNAFHGEKWSYKFHDQASNFAHANSALANLLVAAGRVDR